MHVSLVGRGGGARRPACGMAFVGIAGLCFVKDRKRIILSAKDAESALVGRLVACHLLGQLDSAL